MRPGSSQIRRYERVRRGPPATWVAKPKPGGSGHRAETKGDVNMQPEARLQRLEAVQAHPLAELMDCPPAAGGLLNGSAQCIEFEAGEVVFRQSEPCLGLYLVVSGSFLRRTERMAARLTLGPARAGELVELAAVLGDGRHTYSLSAQTDGSMLLLPMEALSKAFQSYPPLRMKLLEELAREVSRAYLTCCLSRTARLRRQGAEAGVA